MFETTARFLWPDMAVVDWSWKIEGDRNIDGTMRQPRCGMMTMVAEKRNGTRLVVVAVEHECGAGHTARAPG